MEKRDLDLINKYISVDDELRAFVEEHRHFEELLENYTDRAYLTPEEEAEEKQLKKLKLQGRDRIERILAKYRRKEAN